EATRAALGRRRPRDLQQTDALNPLKNQLGYTLAAFDRDGLLAKVADEYLHLAAIVAIDRSRTIEHSDAVPQRQSRARPHLRLKAGRQLEHQAGGNEGALSGRQPDRLLGGEGGDEIHAGGAVAFIARQSQPARVRQTCGADGRLLRLAPWWLAGHVAAVCSASHAAARASRRRATSALASSGQSSTSVAVTRCTVLRSPPMMPVCGDTSLARIQSAPLALRFLRADSTTAVVSAAKPMTSGGRLPGGAVAMLLRISGFSTSSSRGAPAWLPFLIVSEACLATRQSATAAAKMATSQGSALRTACSICCAVSTATSSTPVGAASWLGPEMSVTRAPSACAAAAMAVPCLPEERLAIKRTGSIGSCVGPLVTSTCRPLNGPVARRAAAAGGSLGQRRA